MKKKTLFLAGLLCCILLTACGKFKEPELLWEIPLNTGEENAAAFEPWRGSVEPAPYGISAYTLSADKLFLDDSVNRRILILGKDGSSDELPLPEKRSCHSMMYVPEENALYLLVLKGDVWQSSMEYYRVDLEKGEWVLLCGKIPENPDDYDSNNFPDNFKYTLDENGQVVRYNVFDHNPEIRKYFNSLTGIGFFYPLPVAHYGDRCLCMGCGGFDSSAVDEWLIVFWVDRESGQVEEYSDVLPLGSCLENFCLTTDQKRCAAYYDENGKLCVTYMAPIDEHTLGIYRINLIK